MQKDDHEEAKRLRAALLLQAITLKGHWERSMMNDGKKQTIAFVTNDRFVREKRNLDPADEQIMEEMAQHGELILMSMAEALEAMEKEEPEKFRDFHKQQENQAGRALTMDEIVELAGRGNEKKDLFDTYVNSKMTERQAINIRVLRTKWHYSWRGVARAAFGRVLSKEWEAWQLWYPSSNQLMGMALCQRAAEYFGENYREPPWN